MATLTASNIVDKASIAEQQVAMLKSVNRRKQGRTSAQCSPSTGQLVITGSLPVASLLGSRPAHVVALGGTVREEELACVGPIAVAALARYRADVAVIGAAGVSAAFGITELEDDLAEVNRAAIAHSSRLVVLADGSKIGADAHAVVAPASAISALVTSAGAPADELTALRSSGVEVIIATAPSRSGPRPRGPRRHSAAAGKTFIGVTGRTATRAATGQESGR